MGGTIKAQETQLTFPKILTSRWKSWDLNPGLSPEYKPSERQEALPLQSPAQSREALDGTWLYSLQSNPCLRAAQLCPQGAKTHDSVLVADIVLEAIRSHFWSISVPLPSPMPLHMLFSLPECPFYLPCLENSSSPFDLSLQCHLLGEPPDVWSLALLNSHTLPKNSNLHI